METIGERALAILLSHKKYTITQIADIIEIDRDSVSSWFNKWETNGIEGLSDLQKSGPPPILFNDFKKKSPISYASFGVIKKPFRYCY